MLRFVRDFGFLVVLTGLCVVADAQIIEPVTRINNSSYVMHLEGSILYVGGDQRFYIYDLADPASPRQLGSAEVPGGVSSVAVSGSIALVGLEERSNPNLVVFDVTDRSNPRQLFLRRAGQNATLNDIHAIGSQFLVSVDNTIYTITLSNTNEPLITGTHVVSDFVRDMVFAGSRAYAAADDAIHILDVSDPNNLRETGFEFSDDFNNGIDLEGTTLAVAQGILGVALYDVSSPDTPVFRRHVPFSGESEVFKVDVRQNFVYAALLFNPSGSVFEPDRPGGLRVVDIESVTNARTVLENQIERHAFDVIASNGYVYVAEDSSLSVFRHGPITGDRPTSTPIVPTPTRTHTLTPTPTHTPPFLATATPRPVTPSSTPTRPAPSNTPTTVVVVPSNTPSQPPAVTATPVPPTPVPPTPTSGQGSGLRPVFSAGFDGPLLANDRFAAQLPFSGDFTLAAFSIGALPSASAFAGATNQRGLIVPVKPGEAAMFLGPFLTLEADAPALFRVNAYAVGDAANVALAAVDGVEGTVGLINPVTSRLLTGGFKRISILFNPPSQSFFPLIQVASAGNAESTVYFDNFEVIPLPPGTLLPVEELGVGDIAP